MQGRRKKSQHTVAGIKEKQQARSQENHNPFQRLWPASETLCPRTYNSLLDKNAHYYFVSKSVLKHSQMLSNILDGETKTKNIAEFGQSLNEKYIQVRKLHRKYLNGEKGTEKLSVNDCEKILPYSNSLKPCSRVQLRRMKQNLNSQIIIKQQDHAEFMKNEYNNPKQQGKKMKMIKTTSKVHQLQFVKTCHSFNWKGKQYCFEKKQSSQDKNQQSKIQTSLRSAI